MFCIVETELAPVKVPTYVKTGEIVHLVHNNAHYGYKLIHAEADSMVLLGVEGTSGVIQTTDESDDEWLYKGSPCKVHYTINELKLQYHLDAMKPNGNVNYRPLVQGDEVELFNKSQGISSDYIVRYQDEHNLVLTNKPDDFSFNGPITLIVFSDGTFDYCSTDSDQYQIIRQNVQYIQHDQYQEFLGRQVGTRYDIRIEIETSQGTMTCTLYSGLSKAEAEWELARLVASPMYRTAYDTISISSDAYIVPSTETLKY